MTARLQRLGAKPFYDTTSGIFFDGSQAYVLQPGGEGANLNTALATPGGPTLGNGTEGNLEVGCSRRS